MTPQEQEAFDKGRLQGLKEMDEAHEEGQELLKNHETQTHALDLLKSLRSEYSGK